MISMKLRQMDNLKILAVHHELHCNSIDFVHIRLKILCLLFTDLDRKKELAPTHENE